MSPRTWLERVQDILACARNIQEFTANMNLDAFLKDPRTVRAVAFELTTMGEAARAIPSRSRNGIRISHGLKCRQSAMYWCTFCACAAERAASCFRKLSSPS